MGSSISLPRAADRSIAMWSNKLRCPSAADACGVSMPIIMRVNQDIVSSFNRTPKLVVPDNARPGS